MGVNLIKFDLHIHSIASEYKENSDIVKQSTIENIDILLKKLDENEIALFSITDHNRFNDSLYLAIDEKLNNSTNQFKNVKTILSGVEFDVQIEDGMKKCHIITIFDSKNKPENYQRIREAISKKLLTDKEGFYKKKEFEELLYDIGLNTILIACQRKDIHNHSGKHSSLSDSSTHVEEIISIGYINALEYQKPKVEGILRNNLKQTPNIGLITGSDCHTWNCYPDHDEILKNPDFYPSKAKIIPTFKGLLMAITSPETRINCNENTNPIFIKGIKAKNDTIKFKNGINAIIGENGSGKSTLLKFINGYLHESYVKNIVSINQLELINKIESEKYKYIQQGDIIDKFNDNTLFISKTESNFKKLNHTEFQEEYEHFAELLKEKIELNVRKNQAIESLQDKKINFNPELNVNNYFIQVTCPAEFDEINNKHEKPLKKVQRILRNLVKLKEDQYFEQYKKYIDQAINSLSQVLMQVKADWAILDAEAKIKNIIQGCITDYEFKVNKESSAIDKEKKEYKKKKQNFIDRVINTIKTLNTESPAITEPIKINGFSKNTKRGFYFNREAKYNNTSMLNSFLSFMFNKQYTNLKSVLEINSINDFVNALRNCTSYSDIDIKWKDNLDKFLKDATQENEFITDNLEKQVGNTLGEMSLSYFKYSTQDNSEWNVFIIDQPEDNISNNNISRHLINYFNSIRDTKQLILVTHDPLLVVNLDVDNVVYLQKTNGELTFISGCLEFEDNSVNILDIIANNMDGGKESIEKRLKVYGK